MSINKIVIVGSSNTDMVIRAPYFPAAGETIIGSGFMMHAGGKGANQAVAVARLGGKACFVCKVGDDVFGKKAVELFGQEGIDTSYIFTDTDVPSGVALITVNDTAENTIVVAAGANGCLDENDIDSVAGIIADARYILIQLEIAKETVYYTVKLAHSHKVPVILNPAPACALPDELYKMIAIITPNETEASILSGIEVLDESGAEAAAKILHQKGVGTVIITMGDKGALAYNGETFIRVKAPVVQAVDTTAAGDVFNGALAVALSEGKDLRESVEFACQASSISVTRHGAQASVPYRNELELVQG